MKSQNVPRTQNSSWRSEVGDKGRKRDFGWRLWWTHLQRKDNAGGRPSSLPCLLQHLPNMYDFRALFIHSILRKIPREASEPHRHDEDNRQHSLITPQHYSKQLVCTDSLNPQSSLQGRDCLYSQPSVSVGSISKDSTNFGSNMPQEKNSRKFQKAKFEFAECRQQCT